MENILFKSYEGFVATLVRVTEQGKDLPVIAHDGRSDRQHIAGFALDVDLTEEGKISLVEFMKKLESIEHRWVAIYKATPGTVRLMKGNGIVVHGFKPVKSEDYIVISYEEFLERFTIN